MRIDTFNVIIWFHFCDHIAWLRIIILLYAPFNTTIYPKHGEPGRYSSMNSQDHFLLRKADLEDPLPIKIITKKELNHLDRTIVMVWSLKESR